MVLLCEIHDKISLQIFSLPCLFSLTFFLLLVAFWVVTGPIADLGTAMVNVRNDKQSLKTPELISRTLDAFSDKKAIEQRRKQDMMTDEDWDEWDERYLNNILTARFSNLKFNDASLTQASKIPLADPEMRKFSIDYFWASLPQPFLNALKINVDKKMLKGVSVGDYLYFRAGAPDEALGGYRTGHFAGSGMAAFGYWYLLLLGVGMIPVFYLFDKLYRIVVIPSTDTTKKRFRLQITLCGMLSLDSVFRFPQTFKDILLINLST